MIEAMLHGVVPVATRVSGCVDHIAAGVSGFFLDGVDDRALQAGLTRILATDIETWKMMSRNARAHAAAQFDIQHVAGRYQTLYRGLQRKPSTGFALQ
jgi:glycosyltransferase involved in cell wall biosynthesis